MERSPVITMLFHARILCKPYLTFSNLVYHAAFEFCILLGLMALLMVLDLNFVYIAYNHTLTKGASVQLVFGFEVSHPTL
jgi:hypothetical protein